MSLLNVLSKDRNKIKIEKKPIIQLCKFEYLVNHSNLDYDDLLTFLPGGLVTSRRQVDGRIYKYRHPSFNNHIKHYVDEFLNDLKITYKDTNTIDIYDTPVVSLKHPLMIRSYEPDDNITVVSYVSYTEIKGFQEYFSENELTYPEFLFLYSTYITKKDGPSYLIYDLYHSYSDQPLKMEYISHDVLSSIDTYDCMETKLNITDILKNVYVSFQDLRTVRSEDHRNMISLLQEIDFLKYRYIPTGYTSSMIRLYTSIQRSDSSFIPYLQHFRRHHVPYIHTCETQKEYIYDYLTKEYNYLSNFRYKLSNNTYNNRFRHCYNLITDRYQTSAEMFNDIHSTFVKRHNRMIHDSIDIIIEEHMLDFYNVWRKYSDASVSEHTHI